MSCGVASVFWDTSGEWLVFSFFLTVLFFLLYLVYQRDRGGVEGEGQADSLLRMKPDAGLDLMTLRS